MPQTKPPVLIVLHQEYSTPGHSTASGTNGRSVEKALKPPSTIAISAVGTLTTVVSTVSAISKSS